MNTKEKLEIYEKQGIGPASSLKRLENIQRERSAIKPQVVKRPAKRPSTKIEAA